VHKADIVNHKLNWISLILDMIIYDSQTNC